MSTQFLRKAARGGFPRAIILLFALVFSAATLAETAEAANVPRKYAGIVVDAKTGKTLYANAADSLRYPASVTKVMTLYILFQELAAGNVKLTDSFTVSKHAAAAVPTKLGLPAGSKIKVEDAIESLVTLSANDMARTIAENIEGSESKFAVRMTRTARALGMSRTTYKNASGLPDSGQVTTVRDQARLAVAIYQHFPKYYEYFQTRVFKYRGRSYGNHNHLLGKMGIDGIKTGYINAAGYNLLTAARTGGKHLVVAGFGFDTGASRNAKVASLVKKYLPKARSGDYLRTALIGAPGTTGPRTLVAAIPVDPAPYPGWRDMPVAVAQAIPAPLPASAQPQEVLVAARDTDAPTPLAKPINLIAASAADATAYVASAAPATRNTASNDNDVIGAWMSKTLRFEPGPGNNGLVPPSPIGAGPAGAGPAHTIDLMTSGSVGKEKQSISGWVIQIGAAPTDEGARTLLSSASGSLGNDYRSYVERFEKNGQVFYRARFAGFAERQQAASACEQLKKKNMSCLALQG